MNQNPKPNSTNTTVQIPATEAADRYLSHREDEVRTDTLRGESTPINRFGQWCDQEDKPLRRLNGFDLQAFYDTLKDDDNLTSQATLQNYMTAVRQFLRYLERLDAAPPGISDKVHIPSLEKDQRRRSEEINPDRVNKIVHHLKQFHYASRDHIILLLFWHTGIRLGAAYSLDINHITTLDGSGPVLELNHQPEHGTPLKNGDEGERPINLSQNVADAIHDYIDHNRIDTTDEFGREPLLTSANGRYSKDQIRKTVNYWTCPGNTGIGECSCTDGRIKEKAHNCGESVPPHCIRSASITYWRQNDVPKEVVSDRMNVTDQVLDEHYDRRTEEGKARQRRKFLDSF